MGQIELVLQAYLLIYGAGLAAHYGLMAAAADRAPIYMRAAYLVASTGGFAAMVFSLVPGALAWALAAAALAGGGALVVALKLWVEGVKVCEVMNHADKSMLDTVHEAQR